MSGGPRFDPTINLGHVLTALMMLMAVATGWYSLKGEQDKHDLRITVLERNTERTVLSVDRLVEISGRIDERLKTLERR